MVKIKSVVVALAMVLTLVLSGCGGDDLPSTLMGWGDNVSGGVALLCDIADAVGDDICE